MTTTTTPLPKVSHEETRQRLEAAVLSLTTSEGWAKWLQTKAKFHNYSMYNTLLIGIQCPEATQVAGFRKWQEMGRQVRKGEKAIRILAPILVKKVEDGESRQVLVGFKSVSVFDVSQTDGEALPEAPVTLLEGEAPAGLIDGLMALAAKQGVTVDVETIGGGANGYYMLDGARIVIGDHLPAGGAAFAKTLAHELGHHFDRETMGDARLDMDRGNAELVAESVAYIVGAAHGMATDPYSVGYVAVWSNGEVDKLRGVAQRVDKAATAILKGIA